MAHPNEFAAMETHTERLTRYMEYQVSVALDICKAANAGDIYSAAFCRPADAYSAAFFAAHYARQLYSELK